MQVEHIRLTPALKALGFSSLKVVPTYLSKCLVSNSAINLHSYIADTSEADAAGVPALAVFDLDACLWDQEMFQLDELVDASNPVMGKLGDAGEVSARGGRRGGAAG